MQSRVGEEGVERKRHTCKTHDDKTTMLHRPRGRAEEEKKVETRGEEMVDREQQG